MRRAVLAPAVLITLALVGCSDDDGRAAPTGPTSAPSGSAPADTPPASPAGNPPASPAGNPPASPVTAPPGPADPSAAPTDQGGPGCDRIDGGTDALAASPTGRALSAIGEASRFTATVDALGATADLDGAGPFTVLVPTDAAFAALGDDAPAVEELVTGHLIDDAAADIASLLAEGGATGRLGPISAVQTPEGVLVDRGGGPATVVCRDITTANGVIHLLDTVLLPAPQDMAALGGSQLHRVDLTSGAATNLGAFGDEAGVLGLTVAPDGSLYAVTDAATLLQLDPANPADATSQPIIGIEGTTLLTLDAAPDGRLVAMGDSGTSYEIDPSSARATALPGGLGPPLDDPGLGFDIAADGTGRIVVASGFNATLDIQTGSTITMDAAPTFDAEDPNVAAAPRLIAAASGPDGESFYVIDATTESLAMTTSPADGVLLTVGPLGVPLTDGASFDIAADGTAYLAVPGAGSGD